MVKFNVSEGAVSAVKNENPMGSMPVKKLLLSMAFPIMISMIVQALYNIVDSVFVAMLGEDATNAVNLVFSVQNLMVAFSVGTSVGINSITSRKLGEGDFSGARQVANTGVFLQLVTSLLFVVFGLFFSEGFFNMYSATDSVKSMGVDYMKICTIFSFGSFVSIAVGGIVQCTGKSIYQMLIQLTGAIVNVILDPLFIFGLLGFPKMGVAGAAVATVLGQVASMLVALYINYRVNKKTPITVAEILRPSFSATKAIYKIGLPAVAMQSLGSVMIFFMNIILTNLSYAAVWVFGVFFKLQSLIFMPVFGVSSALVPIVGYNYGARHKLRIQQVILFAVYICAGIMLVGTLLFNLFPKELLMMFSPSEETLAIGTTAFRILSLAYVFAGVAIALSSSLQAIGSAVISLTINVVRQIIFLLPIAFVLANIYGLPAVWLSVPLAEIFATTYAVVMFFKVKRKVVDKLDIEPALELL